MRSEEEVKANRDRELWLIVFGIKEIQKEFNKKTDDLIKSISSVYTQKKGG